MAARVERQGRCLCSAVHVTVSLEKTSVSACHCSICRRWGGGPLMVVESTLPPQLTGEEHVHVYESSEWAERGFCRRCGTHLFYRLKHGDFHAVPVGLFDDPDDWTFALQVFIEEKPAFYCFANDTRTLTGEELIAQFGSE
ncbi:GFA family protein [Pseudomonas luteola]|uniref:GFA family protein n=1 Tax=Pseudomonas luteola TaxID=47886 RepID=UPI001EF49D67|nr:GFA family protein [Pseudomonas luteola]MCG7373475.1 GFA family protein [Pseudomonas luteola]